MGARLSLLTLNTFGSDPVRFVFLRPASAVPPPASVSDACRPGASVWPCRMLSCRTPSRFISIPQPEPVCYAVQGPQSLLVLVVALRSTMERAQSLAELLATAKPDFVALQEVEQW